MLETMRIPGRGSPGRAMRMMDRAEACLDRLPQINLVDLPQDESRIGYLAGGLHRHETEPPQSRAQLCPRQGRLGQPAGGSQSPHPCRARRLRHQRESVATGMGTHGAGIRIFDCLRSVTAYLVFAPWISSINTAAFGIPPLRAAGHRDSAASMVPNRILERSECR